MQIPKNVMQIGQIDAHTKVYMEDYVHTFLEQGKKSETYLVFGKREDRADVHYYLIYGAAKKSDWEQEPHSYFKKYERLGRIEGSENRRIFKPLGDASVILDGYFIFYEQNEDMQSYMITVKEKEAIPGSEEKEEVMEAVRTRRQMRQKEETEGKSEKKEAPESGRAMTRPGQRRRQQAQALKRKAPVLKKGPWTIPELCRAGCLLMLVVLVVFALTSVNRYPDMKAVIGIFSNAANRLGKTEEESSPQAASMIVEETVLPYDAKDVTEAVFNETMESEEELLLAREEGGQINWSIGETKETVSSSETVQETESQSLEQETESESLEPETKEAAQAIARPKSYVVKRGDSLLSISRKFYDTTDMVKQICSINGIEDPDYIQPGQNILLP